MADKDEVEFVAPLKKVKGYGSAHEGVDHWMKQKITAVANIPLILWLIWSIVKLQGASYEIFTTWLAEPVNAILMILVVISVLYHAKLGSQVIVEDYISTEWFKMFKLIGQKIFFFAIGVAIIFSILKIAFTAGV
ncbi:MAG: succinate dehydrogenase, hydrophobic membrane anchor protein [Alphaproteobacteria bacterium]|nr:succinate dehydrogenase, hydrophobic membrane anchor protein [Alphaproteobacteria bacterium]